MSKQHSSSDSPLIAAIRYVFAPIVKETSKLPAPLAYGSAVILIILLIVLLGGVIPQNLIWLLGIFLLASLAAFVFLDWDSRRGKRSNVSAREKTVTVHVVVHQVTDQTVPVAGARVTLVLPEPQTKITQPNGSTIFDGLPRKFVGKSFWVNASAEGFQQRPPIDWILEDGACQYIGLEPISQNAKDMPEKLETAPSSKIRLTQIKPPTEQAIRESITGRLSLGRDPASDVSFPGDAKGVSWEHGLIVLTQNRFVYQHRSESSSTIIKRRSGNQSRLFKEGEKGEFALENQDRLEIGDYEFVVTYNIITIVGGHGTAYTPTDRPAEQD